MLRIHQRDEDLRADIARAGAIAQRVFGENALLTAQGKIGAVVARVSAPCTPERTKRLVVPLTIRAGIDFSRHKFHNPAGGCYPPPWYSCWLSLSFCRAATFGNRLITGVQCSAVAGIHHALQLIVALVEQNEDIKRFFVFAALDQLAQPAQADETKTRREREVLLQQAIAVKVTQIVREQGLVRIKTFLTQGVRRQQLALGCLLTVWQTMPAWCSITSSSSFSASMSGPLKKNSVRSKSGARDAAGHRRQCGPVRRC